MNAALRSKIERRMFEAVCLASLDPRERTLSFSDAGLCEPLLRSGDAATYLSANGTSFPSGLTRGRSTRAGRCP